MFNQTVADIMSRSVVTLKYDIDIYAAVRTLLKHKISGAPVVNEDKKLVGVLSEKDCLKVLVGSALDGLPEGRVSDYMTEQVETISPSSSIYEVVHRFISRSYRRLPVVDDSGCLVGLVSRRDALAAIESIRDNSFLYGTKDQHPPDGSGVDSAMRIARGKKN
jgi:CBS-domain-containing membrane protein